MDHTSTVYLLHFIEGLPRGVHPKSGRTVLTRHYLGSTENLPARLQAHANGRGARLMEVVTERGIDWDLARTWNGGRDLERRLKARKGAPRLCPVCRMGEWPK